jgi:hypothetical protein
MKYLIFAVATLFAAEGVLAQTAAPAEPADKPVVKEAAPSKPATAKDVGTKGMALQAEADRKAKRQAAKAKKKAPRGGSSSTGTDAEKLPPPGSMMTADERTAYRTKLKSFKTLDECEAYTKAHDAEMETRAKAQHKAVRASTGSGCNQYRAAADKTAADKAAPK